MYYLSFKRSIFKAKFLLKVKLGVIKIWEIMKLPIMKILNVSTLIYVFYEVHISANIINEFK